MLELRYLFPRVHHCPSPPSTDRHTCFAINFHPFPTSSAQVKVLFYSTLHLQPWNTPAAAAHLIFEISQFQIALESTCPISPPLSRPPFLCHHRKCNLQVAIRHLTNSHKVHTHAIHDTRISVDCDIQPWQEGIELLGIGAMLT